MVGAGIVVYRDSESLHVGEEIGKLLQAIEISRIYIPIFSENYASSDWCLRELASMVECTSKWRRREILPRKREILPIFLDVDPSDLKLKTNRYKLTLSKRQKTLCSEAESWEKALTIVGKIKGWNWKKDESQADLIKSITETVRRKLNMRIKEIQCLIGLHDRVETILKMLDVGSDSVQFLGIHGMGGIGKTILANVTVNCLSSHFRDLIFFLDVRESSQRHGLVHLQKQLLSKFLDSHFINKIHDVEDGINMIKRLLCNKKVLIVIDGVDEKEQLKSLAGKCDWFGSGSRIIITTRDRSVLTIQGEATGEGSTNILTYEVCEMKFHHALKLFSRHAFRRDSPLDHYISISKKIVRTLGKLPLTLEVIGSFLNGKSIKIWEETLHKLKEALPEEVQQKLMIIYERLDDAQKQVFLDIACFFVNEDKTYPSYMWDACGYCPHDTLEVLFLMSMIRIGFDNTLGMPDQMRELGREIVRKENPDDSCELSRVHNSKDAISILQGKKGSRKIKALSLGSPEDRIEGITGRAIYDEITILKHDEFAGLENLRYFQGRRVSFVGDFNNLLSDLRWLSCHDCPSMLEAKNFHPTNLAVLNLSRCNISEKSIDWLKEAKKLKVLDLNGCFKLRRIPDLSKSVSLEILKIHDCHILESIDGIKAARKLKVINLNGCFKLRKIPDLSKSVSLEILKIRDCHILESIDGIKAARKLKEIDVERCQKLRRIPDLSMLVSLEILRLLY